MTYVGPGSVDYLEDEIDRLAARVRSLTEERDGLLATVAWLETTLADVLTRARQALNSVEEK